MLTVGSQRMMLHSCYWRSIQLPRLECLPDVFTCTEAFMQKFTLRVLRVSRDLRLQPQINIKSIHENTQNTAPKRDQNTAVHSLY
jgi:hypothetical protein